MATLSRDEAENSQEPPLSLRQQQRAVTRERILRALAELLETEHLLEVSMAAVAERAGVSEPTLYRHFSTKRNLFAALGSDLFRQVTAGIAPTNLDELVEIVPTLFRRFAEMESTARWTLAAPEGEAVPRPSSTERLDMLREALGSALDDRSAAEAEFVLRGLLLLTSPLSLIYWQDYLNITVDEAADTAAWLIRQLAEDEPRTEAPTAGPAN
jgi:AcrR family transcriptional regulator